MTLAALALAAACGAPAFAWDGSRMSVLDAVFEEVRKASAYKGPVGKVYFPRPGKSGIPPLFKGKGALAGSPGVGWNDINPDKAVVIVTEELFLLADDADQLAFWLAHEFAHLEAADPKAVEDNYRTLFTRWEKAKAASSDKGYAERIAAAGGSAADRKEFLQAYFEEEQEKALAAFQQPLEDKADARALELLAAYPSKAKPRYDPRKAPGAAGNLARLEKKAGFKGSATHSAVAARVQKLEALIKKLLPAG